MRGTLNKILDLAKKSLIIALSFVFIVGIQVYASSSSTYNQTISAASQSVDIVNSGGTPVGSPSVTFASKNFSFSTQDATGTFGADAQRIRAYNPTTDDTWTVNLAGSAPGAHWTSGGDTYHFDDATGSGYTNGQMAVNPSGGTIAGVPNNTACPITDISAGSNDSFVNGSKDSIDLMSATTGSATVCLWDLTGVAITQKIPASQAVGSYSLTMSLTIL
jgi:hypothetical protein